MKAKWQEEKAVVDGIQTKKKEIEAFRTEADRAERAGDFGKVAEIRYGKIKDAEEELEKLKVELLERRKIVAW